MADIEVEVAVVVEIGKRRGCGSVASSGQSRTRGDVLEGSIAAIVVKRVGLQAGYKQVGMPVIIVVAHRYSLAVTPPPGDRRDSGLLGHVVENAVAAVAKETVARRPVRLPGVTASTS